MDGDADDLEANMAKAAVALLAPNELPFFDVMLDEFDRDPKRALATKGRDDALGFGVGEVGVLVTPIALKVAQDVLQSVFGDALKRASRRGIARLFAAWTWIIHRLRGKSKAKRRRVAPPRIELTSSQLAEVRKVAQTSARASGLDADRAALLADAVVGRLVARAS